MSNKDFGEVPASSTLPIFFSSYGKTNGESITMSGLAVTDIEIYKGVSMTQRASDNGYALIDTDGIDIDGITGIHGFSVDLSDNSDSGFYAVGSFYTVVVSTITIDGQTVSFIAATFRIKAAEAIAGKPKVDVDGWLGTACPSPVRAGVPQVDPYTVVHSGTCQSGSSGSLQVTLSAGAPSYSLVGHRFVPISGIAGGQPAATITSYNTSTKVATLVMTGVTWTSWPDNTTVYNIESAAAVVTDRSQYSLTSGTYNAITSNIDANSAKLANLDATVSSRLATSGYTAPLSAAGTRSAVGLASANLDAQLATLATSDQLNAAVWAQTRFRFSIPEQIEVPESGSTVYRFGITTYDANGALADCVSTPTVSAYYSDATSAGALLGSVSQDATGTYHFDLTLAAGTVAPKYVRFVGTATQGSDDIGMTDETWIVDDLSASFTSTDRTNLGLIKAQTDKLADPLDNNYDAIDHKWLRVETAAQVTNVNDKTGYGVGSVDSDALSDIAEAVRDVDNTSPASDSLGGDLKYIRINGVPASSMDPLARSQLASAVDEQLSETHGDGSWEGAGGGGGEVTGFTDAAMLQMRSGLRGKLLVVRGPVIDGEDGESPTITIMQGDDYLAADGRQIEFDLDGTSLPTLAGATIVLKLRGNPGDEPTEVEGEATVQTGATRTVRFEPTWEDTASVSVTGVKRGKYEVQITDADGHIIRPEEASGELICRKPLG